jgi:hypothetical protein
VNELPEIGKISPETFNEKRENWNTLSLTPSGRLSIMPWRNIVLTSEK